MCRRSDIEILLYGETLKKEAESKISGIFHRKPVNWLKGCNNEFY